MADRLGVPMRTLVRTELLALRTIRTPWLLVTGTVLVTAVTAVMQVVGGGEQGAPSIGTSGAMLAVLDVAGRGVYVALLLGVLAVTTEFRHDTATIAFLHMPRRVRLVAAKALAVVLVGAVLAAVDLAVALAVGLPTGAVPPPLLNGDIGLHVVGQALAYPLYALLGLAIGALVIYQPLAVVLPLAWVLLVEDLVLHLLPDGALQWSLAGVTASLSYAADAIVLPMVVGGLAVLGYALLLLSLGAARVVRRDIT
jgi:ABC-2 type transport system permease protein